MSSESLCDSLLRYSIYYYLMKFRDILFLVIALVLVSVVWNPIWRILTMFTEALVFLMVVFIVYILLRRL